MKDDNIFGYLDDFMDNLYENLKNKTLEELVGKIKATFRLKTQNSLFSPKLYKSGWRGGSRGHIKTYRLSKLLKRPFGLWLSFKKSIQTIKEKGFQSRDSYKELGSSIFGVAADLLFEYKLLSILLIEFPPITAIFIGLGITALAATIGGIFWGKII